MKTIKLVNKPKFDRIANYCHKVEGIWEQGQLVAEKYYFLGRCVAVQTWYKNDGHKQYLL